MNSGNEQIEQPANFAFDAANEAAARQWIAKYPEGRQASAVLPLLDLAQRQSGGWLPRAAMDHVAGILEMAPIRVYEVATFYSMFNLRPVGKFHVQICRTTPCWLRGSDALREAAEKKLGVGLKQPTSDGLFTISEVECLGACCNAPMVQINDDFYEDLTPEIFAALLDALARGETPKAGSQTGRRGSEQVKERTSLLDLAKQGA
ncbi:MAG: NADH-quinone oxidoreductase subunit NuoE [Rhodospirillaceae bacterium]|nr:NADH-quinone oxidoreductase subunit NuoE [Rhodospirillaceae bacterium]